MQSYGIKIDGSDVSAFRAAGYASPPDPGCYESRIVELLDQIGQRTTGTLILGVIACCHEAQVTIIPSPSPVDRGAESTGLNVRIPFPASSSSQGPAAVSQPDAVLLQELVHALHLIRGGFERAPMRDGFDDREEFYAILIANIYLSEDHRPLRRDNHGFEIWDPTGADAERFYLGTLSAIDTLREEGPGLGLQLFMELSRINTPFNPIRQYVKQKAIVFGRTSEAWARDQIRCPVPATPVLNPAPDCILGRRFMFYG
jgi:hypothetical protein